MLAHFQEYDTCTWSRCIYQNTYLSPLLTSAIERKTLSPRKLDQLWFPIERSTLIYPQINLLNKLFVSPFKDKSPRSVLTEIKQPRILSLEKTIELEAVFFPPHCMPTHHISTFCLLLNPFDIVSSVGEHPFRTQAASCWWLTQNKDVEASTAPTALIVKLLQS